MWSHPPFLSKYFWFAIKQLPSIKISINWKLIFFYDLPGKIVIFLYQVYIKMLHI